jgi:hypothetical protein
MSITYIPGSTKTLLSETINDVLNSPHVSTKCIEKRS